MKLAKVKGSDITTSHAVHIVWDANTGQAELTQDNWGDRAVVTNVEDISPTLVLLTVAPDDTDTIEYVEATKDIEYTVDKEDKWRA